MTFRTRILLTFLLLFTISFSIVIVYFYRTTSAAIQEETITHLKADAVWALDDFSEQLESLQIELAAMATARVWYDNSPREYLLTRLKTYKKIYPLFEHISLYDNRGMVIADSGGDDKSAIVDCPCWKEGISGKKGFHVASVKGAQDSAIHFYQGVSNLKGQLPAVLSVRTPLSRLIRQLRRVEKYPHSDISTYLVELLSADGKILYSIPNAPTVGNEAGEWARLRSEVEGLKSRKEASSAWSTDNSLNIVAVSEQGTGENSLPWIMRIHVNKNLLFSTLRKQGENISLLAEIMLGVSAIFIWIAATRLSRPVKELSQLVHDVGAGNLESIKTLPARTDEFSELVESMRMMGGRLESALAELKAREESARQSEKKFRTVADFTTAWEYWLSQAGEFIYISPSCERITGYSALDFQQTPSLLSRIIFPEDRPLYDEHLVSSLKEPAGKETAHDELEYRIVTKDDEIRWIGHVCRPVIDDAGRFLGRRVSNRDITDRKKFEAMIRELNAELEAKVFSRTAELENSVCELESFSYSISHEIRAPLARLEGFCKVLEEEAALCGNEKHRFYAERLAVASIQLREVIDGLLLFTRLPRMEIRGEQVDMSALATGIFGELSAKESGRGAELVIATGVYVQADPELTRICLRALLENALKFTSGRDPSRIEFGMEERGGERICFVRDNGAGFDMNYANRLFIPFQKLHSQKDQAGIGLGLAKAKRIIERHGGKIWAESQPGEGATFYFTMNSFQRELP